LAAALIERLHPRPGTRVLDFSSGSGRNARALRGAGFTVVAIDDTQAASGTPFAGVAGKFTAVVSSHGLLHGTTATVGSRVAEIADRLGSGGLLYAAFGSTRDARFGSGDRLDATTFVPLEGDERGVAHAYFDRERLRALLSAHFEIESLDECGVDDVAGRWAHVEQPLRRAVHWFAVAHKR
jgi:SAM-dependent methyltransferase